MSASRGLVGGFISHGRKEGTPAPSLAAGRRAAGAARRNVPRASGQLHATVGQARPERSRRPRASSRAAGTGPCFVIVKRIGLAGDRLPGRPGPAGPVVPEEEEGELSSKKVLAGNMSNQKSTRDRAENTVGV